MEEGVLNYPGMREMKWRDDRGGEDRGGGVDYFREGNKRR